MTLDALLAEARACRHCAESLPLGPRPALQAGPHARLMIIGQAPGTKVHATGIPFNDPSGDRLRDWLGMDRATFYNPDRLAIMPMGFCYPGRNPRGGDLPPRPECAPLWHPRLLPALGAVELVLLVGLYSQARYLGERRKRTLTETVQAWRDYAPRFLPLPHPSWRNNAWIKKNPWFEAELLPHLKARVGDLT
jgi:uracil-DNA glycosylase